MIKNDNGTIRYFDRHGDEIHAGDRIRFAHGNVERVEMVYEWKDDFGNTGLGTDATNPTWVANGRANPCQYGIYPLTSSETDDCELYGETY